MKAVHLLLAAVLSLAAAQAGAQRLPVPIVNHDKVPLQRAGGVPMSAEEIRKAILAGAVATERRWTVTEPSPGRMIATYQVRTHTVVTEIGYGTGQMSVHYSDSINMKYATGESPGTGVIHPFYNQWVQEFLQAVRRELVRG
jgi:hypothetical protein